MHDRPLYYKKMKEEQATAQGLEADIDVRDWKQYNKESPVVLHVIYESEKELVERSKISCRITVADNEKKNCIMPESRIDKELSPGYFLIAYTCYKIDPSKPHWGDFQVELNVQPCVRRQINTNRRNQFVHTGYNAGGYSYNDDSDDDDDTPA